MATLYLRNAANSAYTVTGWSMAGLPMTTIEGDVGATDEVILQVTVIEDLDGTLRSYLHNDQGFWAELHDGEYVIGFRDARLTAPLPDHDWNKHALPFECRMRRESVINLRRPLGRPAFDHVSARRNQELFLANAADKLRRDRLQLEAVQRDLDAHFVALGEAETAHAAQEATFLAQVAAGV
jgi:hypothetical protein